MLLSSLGYTSRNSSCCFISVWSLSFALHFLLSSIPFATEARGYASNLLFPKFGFSGLLADPLKCGKFQEFFYLGDSADLLFSLLSGLSHSTLISQTRSIFSLVMPIGSNLVIFWDGPFWTWGLKMSSPFGRQNHYFLRRYSSSHYQFRYFESEPATFSEETPIGVCCKFALLAKGFLIESFILFARTYEYRNIAAVSKNVG